MWNARHRDLSELFWGPWRDFDQIRSQLNRFMDGGAQGYPPVNVWSGDDGAVVTMELPGVEPGDLTVDIEGRTLSLRGERKAWPLTDGDSVRRRERFTGEVARTVELPFDVDADGIEASYTAGIVEIRAPRAAADRPRKIEIQAS